MGPTKESKIIIVGGGAFGLSTAYHMLISGYKDVTIVDRTTPPVPDGSSSDISRIVRADYDDLIYASMAREALVEWRSNAALAEAFHECGMLIMTPNEDGENDYLEQAYNNVKKLNGRAARLPTGADARKTLGLPYADALNSHSGYISYEAGWADANEAVAALFRECIGRGAKFVPGTMISIVHSDKKEKVSGIKLEGDEILSADFVVLATGAWTDSLFDTQSRALATGQPVAFIPVDTDEEFAEYSQLPIYINFKTGFYIFPPHPRDRVIKAARHSFGYTNFEPTALDPTRLSSQPQPVNFSAGELPKHLTTLPDDATDCIRHGLTTFLGPQFAKKAFQKTRICWYTDTPTKDFLFDYPPGYENLFIATGGSGHGFKFLPVVGKYALGCIEKSLAQELLDKFAWREKVILVKDGSRGGTPQIPLPNA
ncbi:FAD dependent oxidoreductase [Lipomyces oligophaga]|uniref:FAD dependent oxidoreductase n=1 Tax=Lipomyces oligophaga TaxID=45792 RepID=UPI0034CF9DBE